MNKPYFIDKNINILTGDKALEALTKENDIEFLSDEKGVVKVSVERWKKAQECENKHWMVRGIKSGDDRNNYHSQQFNKYEDIRNITFDSMLEIGCGPFTNSRIIAGICMVNNCSLLDPLITNYLDHSFCYYNKKYLFSEYFPFIGKVIRKVLPVIFRSYLNILSHRTRIKKLLDIPAEKLSANDKYDLVTMINVIEHCYDSELVFQNILNITRAGSYFIFSDKFYEYELIKDSLKVSYDAAHPIKVDRKVIEKYLYDNFEEVFKKIQSNSMSFEGEEMQWDDIYFIGRKK